MKTMLNVALPKGRLGEKVYAMFEKAGFPCPSIYDGSRKLIFENEESDKIELAVGGFWDYPRRNPISKKDLVKVKEKAVEHFRKQNKKVDFIDMQE